MSNRYSFQILKDKCGGRIKDVEERLGVSLGMVYRLQHPEKYGWPEAVFDHRGDLADTIAVVCEIEASEVVSFYLDRWVTNKLLKKQQELQGETHEYVTR